MPKNVMKLIKPSPHRGRNDFDLSHRTVMDMNFGALHSPMQIETVPGDDYRIGVADLHHKLFKIMPQIMIRNPP